MMWIKITDQYPPIWKKVKVRKYSDEVFDAYRTIFGNWKCNSGYTDYISRSDEWAYLDEKL